MSNVDSKTVSNVHQDLNSISMPCGVDLEVHSDSTSRILDLVQGITIKF